MKKLIILILIFFLPLVCNGGELVVPQGASGGTDTAGDNTWTGDNTFTQPIVVDGDPSRVTWEQNGREIQATMIDNATLEFSGVGMDLSGLNLDVAMDQITPSAGVRLPLGPNFTTDQADMGFGKPLILQGKYYVLGNGSTVYSTGGPFDNGTSESSFFEITIPNGEAVGGNINYSVRVAALNSGFVPSGVQSYTGSASFSAINLNGTVTSQMVDSATVSEISSGVFTIAPTTEMTNGASKVIFSMTAGSNMTGFAVFHTAWLTVFMNSATSIITELP